MTQNYVGLKVVTAWPQPANKDVDAIDGYAVKYADGYTSWSPKAVFEEAYKPSGKMDFSQALFLAKQGMKIARSGWNGKGLWLEVQRPDEHSKMTLPYLYINYPDDALNTPGARCPWLASQTDLMAEDWCVVDPEDGLWKNA